MSGPTPAQGYAALTEAEQVAIVRGTAEHAAPAFGLDPATIQLVLHAFNTTFSAHRDDGGAKVAMRVNTNSLSTPAHVIAQSAWVRDLANDTGIRLPVPLLTTDGATHVVIDGRIVTVSTWLEGDDVGECEAVHAHALGRTMALMHEHAQRWRLPEGAHLDTFDDPFFGDEDRLTAACAGRPDAALLSDALDRCSTAVAEEAQAHEQHIIHGDLHGGNLKWHQGELAVFDFDDCGIATPTLDLAIATFYLRRSDPAVEAALREGYTEVRSLPEAATDHDTFEAIVASRQFLLANDLLRSSTPEFREMAVGYLDTTLDRLTRWRTTGTFRL